MNYIEFIYFDLGNVLLRFDHDLACQQVAELCNLPIDKVREILFDSGFQHRYEKGEVTTADFHAHFCEAAAVEVSIEQLCLAASNIFNAKEQNIKLAQSLKSVGHRIGLLSNTCDCHWQFCKGQKEFSFLNDLFETIILSFEVGSMKPEAKIYQAAASQAKTEPAKILFIDDRPDNIAGAKDFGFDTILYQGLGPLIKQLVKRGLMSAGK